VQESVVPKLPGLDCGLCGYPTCDGFNERLKQDPGLVKRCIHLDTKSALPVGRQQGRESVPTQKTCALRGDASIVSGNGHACVGSECQKSSMASSRTEWRDSLGREFDFVLQHFPEEPGPREIIVPHNPMLTREMEIRKGEVLVGRPLGMSCGCPVTHCGEVMDVDPRTGVMTWCITGPLRPRQEGFRDIGFYSAEAYEGLVQDSRCELKIGMRYFFQPEMCMLQWRHSGLLNYLNHTSKGLQVRLEGLWIG